MAMVAQPISPRVLTFASAVRPETKRGFSPLDEHVLTGAGGVVFVRSTSLAAARALEGHLARRVTNLGWLPFVSRSPIGGPLWREVGSVLGIGSVPCNPRQCAEAIAEAAASRRVVVIAPLPRSGTWARSVAAELSLLATPLTVFQSCDPDETAPDLRAEAFDIEATLDADDKKRWWAAAAYDAFTGVESDDLTTLDTWWTGLRRTPAPTEAPPIDALTGAEHLFQALALVARPWPAAEAARFGATNEALEELLRVGAAQAVRGWITIQAGYEEHAAAVEKIAPVDLVRKVAEALLDRFEQDPWALARAADLFVRAQDFERADDAHARSIASVDDALARAELMDHWFEVVASVPNDEQLTLRIRATERALAAGEAEDAYQWAQSATALAKDNVRVTLLFGQAAVMLGDFLAARVAFESQRALANDPELNARVSVELAEVAFGLGDITTAAAEAELALTISGDVGTRLDARNTLGKILLTQAKWDDAEQHFAEDDWTASSNGLITEALRAQVNRGIALFSKGLMNEARAIFERVLTSGESLGDVRACAFALDNLAVVAIRTHEYTNALALMERTVKLRQRLGDRGSMARVLTNLAELRGRLGLFAHAEHALAFGRRVFGPRMPPSRSAHIALVAARVALARGDTAAAERALSSAIVASEAANVRNYVGETCRVATRIALEHGDLTRARATLARAKENATTDLASAEVGLLAAHLAKASGEQDEALALTAHSLARAAGDEELLIESNTLLSNVFRAKGALETAREHVQQALAIRDQVAHTLTEDVRAAYLARPSIAALADLHAVLCGGPAPAPSPSTALDRAPTLAGAILTNDGDPTRAIIGDDPAIRALRIVIKRVATCNSTVLIRGESGTGKELVAEAIHRASERSEGPLVSVNCAALVETLLLSELFGHEKGAFTGASSRRRGRFELAEGGTLFLDEIGDISPRTQVALLRVLQDRVFERVGGNSPIRADVRIVCATHRDLRGMVDRGDFREDLYYRLRGITLEVPPLRQRLGDLPAIAQHLLARVARERREAPKGLRKDALDLLTRHPWPGNIRELENVLRAASLFAEGDEITAACLADNVDDLRRTANEETRDRELSAEDDEGDDGVPVPTGPAPAIGSVYEQIRQGMSLSGVKKQIERDCIARALAETRGNITRAATLLGMKRPRLSQLVKQYGLAAYFSEAS